MSKTLPLVSILIPAYGHANLILETLESVFAQTYNQYEVIVVNDGSPDNTAQRLEPLVRADRIRYFEQSNGGQAAARNRALAEARGEFVAYLDDDDLWPPDKLEWQVHWLENRQRDVVAGNVAYLGGLGFVPDWPDDGMPLDFRSFFRGNPIISPGQVLIRRRTLLQVGRWDKRFAGTDDLDMWFRLAKVTQLWAVARIALCYRLHPGNASNDSIAMARNVWAVMERHLRDLPFRERVRQRRSAAIYLQYYLGSRLFSAGKSALRHGELLRAVHVFKAAGPIIANFFNVFEFMIHFVRACARSLRRWRKLI